MLFGYNVKLLGLLSLSPRLTLQNIIPSLKGLGEFCNKQQKVCSLSLAYLCITFWPEAVANANFVRNQSCSLMTFYRQPRSGTDISLMFRLFVPSALDVIVMFPRKIVSKPRCLLPVSRVSSLGTTIKTANTADSSTSLLERYFIRGLSFLMRSVSTSIFNPLLLEPTLSFP